MLEAQAETALHWAVPLVRAKIEMEPILDVTPTYPHPASRPQNGMQIGSSAEQGKVSRQAQSQ